MDDEDGDIIICIANGAASLIKAPLGTRVILHDYDIPQDWDQDDEQTGYDAEGDRYQIITLEQP